MSIIRVEQLSKAYPGGRGVADVGFTVDEGEIFGILGPNGAGKTTTVECIGGLRSRDGGVIDVAGFDPASDSVGLREVLGVQLQESTLPDKIRVGEALALFASFHDDPADAGELAERLGLAAHARMQYGKLSGGQKQRLSVALALIGRPRVAILDELTTGLDPQARRDVWGLLEDLRSTGVTLLLVSHFMEEAQRLCDRVAVIDNGRVAAIGTPNELADRAGVQVMVFTPSVPVDLGRLRTLPSVGEVDQRGEQLHVSGGDDVVAEVIVELGAQGATAAHLRVDRPSLDDAFVSLVSSGKVNR
ncbi:ABC transporter ATP-binding protein [Williamsia phyllosphaerae]|uniref:Multidrug ABC transporter ATP-binding protein n=1 Tax=Williamsia phyllosphaerae TaxID=885042 RepID=A0ABQ1UK23_9NOCA|nr:ABC transporter ATP-binding protein [Williamsia phyllosphaerae]GGF18681.1 multidrug ABC transporter ATP-binding protein [Williamsia phyllosphaerae]